MSREIKFRGWVVNRNHMIDLKKITPLALDAKIANEDGVFLPFNENIILMQFTGLKDKNGKEIFEGDIVRATNADDKLSEFDSNTGTGRVEFFHGMWYITNRVENALYDLVNDGYFIEVTTNIYETPELLKP